MNNKHSYFQQVGALFDGMNRMNTYMGRVAAADKNCASILRKMRG